MDQDKIKAFVDNAWDGSIVSRLEEYITIPNQSPAYDPEWDTNGHMDKVVKLATDWVKAQKVAGLEMEVIKLEGRTPVIYMEIPGDSDETILLYGHLDKQPPMLPWAEGLDPYKPVVRDGRLYGRGGADDGYAIFGSVAALQALKDQGIPHGRCVVIIETCEESGSFDLPAYIDHLQERIGTPSLIVCLDSGCGNYDQLWVTTSLRGLVSGILRIDVLEQGVHSGDASGLVPSSFRILRQLLDRVDNSATGEVFSDAFYTEIPSGRREQAALTAKILGNVAAKFPFVDGMIPATNDTTEQLLNRTWRPQLSITGVDGMPPLEQAGNVLRPHTSVMVSLRIPARVNPDVAGKALSDLLTADPPYGAKVTFKPEQGAPGWDAPPVAEWLEKSSGEASEAFFGKPAAYYGEGGTIPFMGMLGEKFPEAQFLITGVLGPASNAHGPNEFLDIECGKKLTACVAKVVADHYKAKS
jgi:acetylornithine deacetylase/succinyl-diaminopimelate desuccinylase-like protein